MQQLKDIIFQCNPCVMCRNNIFHCDSKDTCNASKKWIELIEHLNLLENDNKSMSQELGAYYSESNDIAIGDYIQRLGYRIDCIQQPFYNANIPALYGHRLSKMFLPDDQLKKMNRVWQVGIYTDKDKRGV